MSHGVTATLFLIVICTVAAHMMSSIWEAKRDELSCRYCGTYRGHTQDCPYDFEQREGR